MERTISGMMGKGAINHNTRAFNAKNVDPERSIYNVQFCNTSIKRYITNYLMKHWSGIMQSRNEVTGRLIIIMKNQTE